MAEQKEEKTNDKTSFSFLSPYYDGDQVSQEKTNLFRKKIEELKEVNQDIDFSVYFRDLNNGPWLSYNTLVTFDGASLLKLPILVMYLKAAENYPNLLQEKVVYEEEFSKDLNPNAEFDQTLKIGETYTIDYLLKTMIQKSDNTAKNILLNVAEQLELKPGVTDTRKLIGLYQETEDEINEVSAEQYAGIFRILYNSEYLSPEMSNKALKILSGTEYTDGLVAYLPKNTIVSHKYGVRYSDINSGYQLHDCGIIYTKNPYSLCVMTIGNDQLKQRELISKIAKESFDLFK